MRRRPPTPGSAVPGYSAARSRRDRDDRDAVRQHPDVRGTWQGQEGRDRPAGHRGHLRRDQIAGSGRLGRDRGHRPARLVRRGQARGANGEVNVSIRDPRFTGVVGPGLEFEQIATGCLFTEGPLWHPVDHYLLWSDMPGDHLRRWSAREGVRTYRKPSRMSNGLTWDREGRLLACEHASSQVTRTEPDGRITALATHHEGKQLNSPNDIVCAADGGIYFSDPPYGRMDFYGVKREQELAFQGVYRAGSDPKHPRLVVDDFDR